ncbi:D-sedoheptulose-7-phosphate isomerase [Embleya scabrispora]|uniref:D-sedoheptulose-7-phosphate isomerase n=1 Tax=Embleya scabrispora TaxID=159449 RepID=UPI000C7CE5F0|nr:SIS domain-containing protein [Embleya scabrispora]
MSTRRWRHVVPSGGERRHRVGGRDGTAGSARGQLSGNDRHDSSGRRRARVAGGVDALAREHVDALVGALRNPLCDPGRAARWGNRLAPELAAGARLLVAGNGGSAAEAQHLTAELVGRYRDERRPLSALALHAETSSVTAIVNDYGADEVFARQIEAHGRIGDTVLLLSTSGSSTNVLCAARRARALGLRVWALTGPAPNELASLADDALCVEADNTATVQEVHLLAAHLLCEGIDAVLSAGATPGLRTRLAPVREALA